MLITSTPLTTHEMIVLRAHVTRKLSARADRAPHVPARGVPRGDCVAD